ncbi:MAG: hypothetical protein PHR16_12245 [Methylovulum sp.]|nr:hypothetical protein [Methylovulum sp.]
MRCLIGLVAVSLLSSCSPVQPKKEPALPPLSTVIPLIKQGMSVADVNKALSGHQPALQYSLPDSSIWELNERTNNLDNHSINANRLTIKFDNNGEVSEAASVFCFLPDQEVSFGSTPTTRCYQKRLFPFNKKTTYDAIKRLLIISNYQIDHSDAVSQLISATGTQNMEGDNDKMMFIKLSITFSVINGNTTEVVMSATFNISEKQETWVQAGFAGVTIPVPLPFQKKEEWIETGIVPPKFYLDFYDGLSKLIAREYLPYTPIISHPAAYPSKGSTIKTATSPPNKTDNFLSYTITPIQEETELPDGDVLNNLNAPIDAKPIQEKIKNNKKLKSQKQKEAPLDNSDPFANLQGKPIDSYR